MQLELGAGCTCPMYESGSFCKHIWATLLEMDAAGTGERVPGTEELDLFEPWGKTNSESRRVTSTHGTRMIQSLT